MKKKYINWLIAFLLLLTFITSLSVVWLDYRTLKMQKKVDSIHITGK